ncbi:MAG TPA: serine/threonine-protein kinase [Pyrinomonadaceae bacterium]|nr:serine/threonine-protein kinase [Pyrinomonadaceae bacterium]
MTCSGEVPEGSSACPSCGAGGDASVQPTRLMPEESPRVVGRGGTHGRRAATAPTVTSSFPNSIDDARFIPGAILAGRYRITGLLGRGGMGEVYRADDLKLGQPVALKFLPEQLSSDPATLARFHREVRIARQISHPNVCRVYDIGEAEGLHFLSMEYIRGEELASMLKRFGRPPADRATEIARQICAGLAAAHKTGVLHRDLKPSNVMIDAEGGARVTDFGLAAAAEEVRGREVFAGTPAYMAPEQFAGREVSVRSDIYSLGLVLYELFTGKRAYEARTAEELVRLHGDATTEPTSPSSIVKEIDPLVERVILRCLARDPEERPSSALQVAAALPGGDPLAAALAMGETPSPEMVAAAPKQGALRPPVAAAWFGALVVLVALSCLLSKQATLYRVAAPEKSPEFLREHARELVRQFGYTDPPLDAAHGQLVKFDHLEYIARTDSSPRRWERLRNERPGPYRFWYRQSPRYLTSYDGVDPDHPSHDQSGMVTLFTDAAGRMTYLIAVPPQRLDAAPEATAPDWPRLFAAAGLDPAHFRETAPEWIPLHESDARGAWARSDDAPADYPARVEAAAYRGRPIYFEVIYPWDMAARQDEPALGAARRAFGVVVIVVFLLTLVGGALLALRNLRSGRGDRRGAFRLAVFLFAAHMAVWLFDAHHVGALGEEFKTFVWYVQASLFGASFLWVLYVALEPFVRRRWPHRIISWTRLVGGDFSDPLVGRDILIGAVFGAGLMFAHYLTRAAPAWFGGAPGTPLNVDGQMLGGLSYFTTSLAWQLTAALFLSFIFLFLLLLFFNVLRRERVALAALWLFVTVALVLNNPPEPETPARLLATALGGVLIVVPLYRYGLLAMVSSMFFTHIAIFYPVTTDFSAWYVGDFIAALVVSATLAAYAFHTSLAGQKLFSGKFLQD